MNIEIFFFLSPRQVASRDLPPSGARRLSSRTRGNNLLRCLANVLRRKVVVDVGIDAGLENGNKISLQTVLLYSIEFQILLYESL